MFVKRIGDIRIPEHSAEVLVPLYSADDQIDGFANPWPYTYQTSRDPKDQGFRKWRGNSGFTSPDDHNLGYYTVPYNPDYEGHDLDFNPADYGYRPDGVNYGPTTGTGITTKLKDVFYILILK